MRDADGDFEAPAICWPVVSINPAMTSAITNRLRVDLRCMVLPPCILVSPDSGAVISEEMITRQPHRNMTRT
jgi:hypothetical protein